MPICTQDLFDLDLLYDSDWIYHRLAHMQVMLIVGRNYQPRIIPERRSPRNAIEANFRGRDADRIEYFANAIPWSDNKARNSEQETDAKSDRSSSSSGAGQSEQGSHTRWRSKQDASSNQ